MRDDVVPLEEPYTDKKGRVCYEIKYVGVLGDMRKVMLTGIIQSPQGSAIHPPHPLPAPQEVDQGRGRGPVQPRPVGGAVGHDQERPLGVESLVLLLRRLACMHWVQVLDCGVRGQWDLSVREV